VATHLEGALGRGWRERGAMHLPGHRRTEAGAPAGRTVPRGCSPGCDRRSLPGLPLAHRTRRPDLALAVSTPVAAAAAATAAAAAAAAAAADVAAAVAAAVAADYAEAAAEAHPGREVAGLCAQVQRRLLHCKINKATLVFSTLSTFDLLHFSFLLLSLFLYNY
jgi:hypothetical protein